MCRPSVPDHVLAYYVNFIQYRGAHPDSKWLDFDVESGLEILIRFLSALWKRHLILGTTLSIQKPSCLDIEKVEKKVMFIVSH